MQQPSTRREALQMAGAAIAGVGVLAVAPQASATASANDEAADFKGKVVALTLPQPIGGAYLQNAQLKTLGGRVFFVGSYAKQDDATDYPEMVMWLPVDRVEGITVYNSLNDARKAYDIRKKADK